MWAPCAWIGVVLDAGLDGLPTGRQTGAKAALAGRDSARNGATQGDTVCWVIRSADCRQGTSAVVGQIHAERAAATAGRPCRLRQNCEQERYREGEDEGGVVTADVTRH